MRFCTRIFLVVLLVLFLLSLAYCAGSCQGRRVGKVEPKPPTYVPTQPDQPPAEETVPEPPVTEPTAPIEPVEGKIQIDLSKAKISGEFNPDNGTTTKKLDLAPITSDEGFQIYVVGAEFNGRLFLLVKTQLHVSSVTFNEDFSPTNKPQFLEIQILGPPGQDYLFSLPLAAKSGAVTINYQP